MSASLVVDAATATPGVSTGNGTARVSGSEGMEETRSTIAAATTTVGIVVVSLLEKATASTYGETSAHIEAYERSFVALLAPNATAAMEFLSTQPPSGYVLSKGEDGSIELYLKFLQAVRMVVVVKAKEWKKGHGTVAWDTSERCHGAVRGALPPVHHMRVDEEIYFNLERCWCEFVPHVQSIVFELCCELPIDEALRLEECADLLESSSPPPLLALLASDSCSFYLLDSQSGLREQSLGVFSIRQVEFDFVKFSVNVADGTFKPTALLMATQLSHRRSLDPDLTFKILRDNFQFPERVMLKETSVTLTPSGPHHYIEVSVNDRELMLLRSVESVCKSVLPLGTSPLPDTLLTALDGLYLHLVASYETSSTETERHISRLSAEKSKLVSSAFPVIIEMIVAIELVCDYHSTSGSHPRSDGKAYHEQASRLSKALHLIAVTVASRCDDAAISRIVFVILRLFALRRQIPSALVKVTRDLCGKNSQFRRLFTRSHAFRLLWSAIHSTTHPLEKVGSHSDSSGPTSSSSGFESRKPGQRKSSLFARIAQGPKKRSLLDSGIKASDSHVRFYALFRFDPSFVELGLLKLLAARQFCQVDSNQVEPTLECCYCHRFVKDDGKNRPENKMQARQNCARRLTNEPVLVSVFELVLELGKHFLIHNAKSHWWDKSIAMIIRCEKLHASITEDLYHLSGQLSHSENISDQLVASMECRRFIAVECIAMLYTLERKRRQHMTTVIGDKKYLPFLELIQSKMNDVNESLAGHSSDFTLVISVLEAHVVIFRWVPVRLFEEWLTLSIGQLFETVDVLNRRLKQNSSEATISLARAVGAITEIFSIILQRIISSDLPTLLIRLLNRGFKPITPLLRSVLSNDETYAISAKCRVIRFLTAFSSAYRDLPVRNQWFRIHSNAIVNEDEEELEQRRDQILQQYLVFEEKHDMSLWEFLVRFACPAPSEDATSIEDLCVIPRYPNINPTLLMDETLGEAFSLLIGAGLTLQLTLYGSLSRDYNVEVNIVQAVTDHISNLSICSKLIDESVNCDVDPSQLYSVCRVLALHLHCLISLANRRTLFPEIQEAFDKNNVLSVLIKFLVAPTHQYLPIANVSLTSCSQPCGVKANDVLQTQGAATTAQTLDDETSMQCQEPPIFRLRLDKIQRSDSMLSSGSIIEVEGSSGKAQSLSPRGIIVRDDNLHALLVVLFISYMLVEPTHELDETFCPRFSPTAHEDQPDWPSNDRSRLLWQLQWHLTNDCALDMAHFERVLFDMETTHAFVSASRASAIRRVIRLICPHVYDRTLYAAPGEACTPSLNLPHDIKLVSARKDYISKGATSTVYRTTPVIHHPTSVTLKILRQERDGNLCAIARVYNEIAVLKRLRGERAALQMLDFGNRQDEKSYEVVTEWCPATLSEWRRSFTRQTAIHETTHEIISVSFRMCVLMILRCFRKVCVCLARVHGRGVCHFDIKSENIFLRTSSSDFSARLVMHGEKNEDELKTSSLQGCVCFGDFGESMIAEPDPAPLRACMSFISGGPSASSSAPLPARKKSSTTLFYLSRTRGTEAIKSPEVFKIRGNEEEKTKVTFASDIWSIGCLLYELIVQELLFEKDDWPSLYAHLVTASEESTVLREDHIQKLQEALSPTCDDEKRIATQLINFCASILDRKPERRPTLLSIIQRVSAIIQDVLQLPISAEEKTQMKHLADAQAETTNNFSRSSPVENAASLTTFRAWHRRPSVSAASYAFQKSDWSRWYPTVVAPRLFWNFFIGGTIPQLRCHLLSNVGIDILACQDFEITHEHEFVHFVYFSWAPDVDGNPNTSSSVIARVHENERYTIIQIDRRVWQSHHESRQCISGNMESTTALALNCLLREAPVYFPVLQRRLRLEPGRVVLVCAPEERASERDTSAEALQDAMASILFLFFERTTAMSPLETLAAFARDCSPHFLAYPHRSFANQLCAFSTQHQEIRRELAASETQHARDDQKRHVVLCLCGACVWSVQELAVRNATSTQKCSCPTDGKQCPSFHPFTPSNRLPRRDPRQHNGAKEDGEEDVEDDPLDGDDELNPVDDTFIHDPWEEQLVLPMEVRAKQQSPVPWVVVDRSSVERRNSLLVPCPSSPSAPGESNPAPRRASALLRMVGKDSGESPRVHAAPSSAASTWTRDPLLRGLMKRVARSRRSSSSAWTLLECKLCRLPMLGVCDSDASRVALPLLGDLRSVGSS